ncbi:hypothetical protein SLA2020_139640 [Shorea laevis]
MSGKSYSFLVMINQNTGSRFYVVASVRLVNESIWQRVSGVAILHYSNSKGLATDLLLDVPADIYNPWLAVNQPRSIRLKTYASRARPNL